MQGMLFSSSDEKLTEESLARALQHGFINARKYYLKDHEFYIVIGGNDRAELECKAVRELETVKLLPVGCFGGTALKVSEDLSYNCVPFITNDNMWCDGDLDRLLDVMQNT